MRFKKYDKENLIDAINSSISLRGVLKKLDIVPAGGNYQTLKNAIEFYKIDTSHFKGKGHLKNCTHNWQTRKLEEILVNKKHENTFSLKKRLLNENVKKHKCEQCFLEKWLSKPMPLELHHVDGNRKNNELSNLQLLCPNCHSLTDNYRGKMKKENMKKSEYLKRMRKIKIL